LATRCHATLLVDEVERLQPRHRVGAEVGLLALVVRARRLGLQARLVADQLVAAVAALQLPVRRRRREHRGAETLELAADEHCDFFERDVVRGVALGFAQRERQAASALDLDQPRDDALHVGVRIGRGGQREARERVVGAGGGELLEERSERVQGRR